MLVVKIELWPGGVEEEAQPLGMMQIINDGTGSYGRGNYDTRILKWDSTGSWKEGRVEGFPRAKFSPWDLAFRALRSMIGYRNEKTRSRDYRPDSKKFKK